jgi:hypothetical protein
MVWQLILSSSIRVVRNITATSIGLSGWKYHTYDIWQCTRLVEVLHKKLTNLMFLGWCWSTCKNNWFFLSLNSGVWKHQTLADVCLSCFKVFPFFFFNNEIPMSGFELWFWKWLPDIGFGGMCSLNAFKNCNLTFFCNGLLLKFSWTL